MSNEGIYIEDPNGGEPIFMPYSEMEQSAIDQLIKPIGGFCYRANEFTQIKLPKIPFYIKDWLPKRGKLLIYAPRKSGKSYICLQIARCIATGQDFLGIPTSQGTVFYCQLELGAEILQHRMKEEVKKSYPNVFVGTIFKMKLDTQGGQRLMDTAMQALEPDVLIIDPKRKIMAGDENEAKDTAILTDYLDDLIEAYDCAIIVIHHTGKDEKKRGRGSIVMEDWADSVIAMKKTSKRTEPLKIKLMPDALRHAPLPENPIEAVMKDFEFELISESTLSIRDEVAKVIAVSAVPISPKTLFDLGIGTNASVFSALNKLIAQGRVNRVGRGLYEWKKGGKG